MSNKKFFYYGLLVCFIVCFVDASLFAGRTVYSGDQWGYGWVNGVEKIMRNAEKFDFKGEIGGTVKLSLARNEYEGVQIVLQSPKYARKVKVKVSDLKSDSGDVLLAKKIEVLPVGYVHTEKPKYEVDNVGWWPDVLLTFMDQFDVEPNKYQPVWLDVFANKDQPAGLYRGTVTVTGDGLKTLQIPLELTVWDFVIPKEHHLPQAYSWYDFRVSQIYGQNKSEKKRYNEFCNNYKLDESYLGNGEARRLNEIRLDGYDLLLKHRIAPGNLYRGYPPRIEDVKRWKMQGVRNFNVLYIDKIWDKKVHETYPEARTKWYLKLLADYIPVLRKEGLDDIAYIYAFDEINQRQFGATRDILSKIKKLYPEIPIMTTAYDYSYGLDTGLDDVIDIWVPLTPKYDSTTENIKKARNRGKQVWWYICCGPRHPYANWFVEYSAAEHRSLMGFMAYKFKTQGFLYYLTNRWLIHKRKSNGQNDWDGYENNEIVKCGSLTLTNQSCRSFKNYNGDGQIVYPGPDGTIPSLRIKCIRDGLEDYEYLWLLKQAVYKVENGSKKMPVDWLKKAKTILEIDSMVVKDLKNYSRKGQNILTFRQKIAELLNKF